MQSIIMHTPPPKKKMRQALAKEHYTIFPIRLQFEYKLVLKIMFIHTYEPINYLIKQY